MGKDKKGQVGGGNEETFCEKQGGLGRDDNIRELRLRIVKEGKEGRKEGRINQKKKRKGRKDS
jgi:hypothetical protein